MKRNIRWLFLFSLLFIIVQQASANASYRSYDIMTYPDLFESASIETIRNNLEATLQQTIDAKGIDATEVAEVLYLMANFERDTGNFDVADPYYDEAIRLLSSSADDDQDRLFQIHADRAWFYFLSDRKVKSAEIYSYLFATYFKDALQRGELFAILNHIRYARILQESGMFDQLPNFIDQNHKRLDQLATIYDEGVLAPLWFDLALLEFNQAIRLRDYKQTTAKFHAALSWVEPAFSRLPYHEGHLIISDYEKAALQYKMALIHLERGDRVKALSILSDADITLSNHDLIQASYSYPQIYISTHLNVKMLIASLYMAGGKYSLARDHYLTLIEETGQIWFNPTLRAKDTIRNDMIYMNLLAHQQLIGITATLDETKSMEEWAERYLNIHNQIPLSQQLFYAQGLTKIANSVEAMIDPELATSYYRKAHALLQSLLPADATILRRIRVKLRDIDGKAIWPDQTPVALEKQFFKSYTRDHLQDSAFDDPLHSSQLINQ